MDNVFNPGDVVRLKSYSVQMTVDRILPNGKVTTMWFDEDRHLCTGDFEPVNLIAVDFGNGQ